LSTAATERGRAVARDRLIESATALLAEFGVEAVNSNRIARAAGVGVGTFYGQFEDKHALHRAVVLRAYEKLADSLVRVAAGSESSETEDPEGRAGSDTLSDIHSDIEAQVRALVEATLEFAAREPELFRVAFARPLPPAAKGRPAMAFSIRPVEQRLRALQREGRLAAGLNPELAARAFAGMQSAVLLGWLDEPDRLARRDVIETLVRLHPAVAARASGPTRETQ